MNYGVLRDIRCPYSDSFLPFCKTYGVTPRLYSASCSLSTRSLNPAFVICTLRGFAVAFRFSNYYLPTLGFLPIAFLPSAFCHPVNTTRIYLLPERKYDFENPPPRGKARLICICFPSQVPISLPSYQRESPEQRPIFFCFCFTSCLLFLVRVKFAFSLWLGT